MDLHTRIDDAFRLKLPQKKALERMGLITVSDLLYHFPNRFREEGNVVSVEKATKDALVTIYGVLKNIETKRAFRKKIPMTTARLYDETGTIQVIWFHQAFIGKTIPENTKVKITGKVSENAQGVYISNPEYEIVSGQIPTHTTNLFEEQGGNGGLYPIYPESRGITSRWIHHAILKLLQDDILTHCDDPIPEKILAKYNLPKLATALIWIHKPRKEKDFVAARKRFSFQEIFFIQTARLLDKKTYSERGAFKIDTTNKKIKEFTDSFPFSLTSAQKKSLNQILKDLGKKTPMMRLLEGDVGSGKTAVAAGAVYATIHTRPPNQDFGRLQATYMAPTEILARQLFESFITYFKGTNIQVGFISGAGCRKFPSKIDPSGHTNISRTQLLKWVANGEIPVVIGTHSLIQDTVKFKQLALAIIDEQHRFGVKQRSKLTQKKNDDEKVVPHLLSMTATPIPRTLALTVYGDLDLSIIDEMPAGRKKVITETITPKERPRVYKRIKDELISGRQVYVICPRIDEPDPDKALALRVKSAKEEAKRLAKEYPEYSVGLVHSKLKPKDKEEVMHDFLQGKIDILTSTSVVEVGVNIPNATNMIIEGAERFGLAQLHQLRGRIIRSNHQAYCYLFSNSTTQKTKDRLSALVSAKNGFELAELDLSLRGEGSLAGAKQWGISDIGMEAIKNIKMVEAARTEAHNIIEKDKTLMKYPRIAEGILSKKLRIHFE